MHINDKVDFSNLNNLKSIEFIIQKNNNKTLLE